MAEDQYREKEIDRRLEWLEERYANFNSEMGKVQESANWLTWATRWIITGVIGNLLLALTSILLNMSLK